MELISVSFSRRSQIAKKVPQCMLRSISTKLFSSLSSPYPAAGLASLTLSVGAPHEHVIIARIMSLRIRTVDLS